MRIFLVFVLVYFCFGLPGKSTLAEENAVDTVGVDRLMKNPGNYTHSVRVAGVVSQVFDERGMFGMIDLEEFRRCGKVTCSLLMLPVSWQGPMPDVGSQVLISGKIGEAEGRRLFIADKIDFAKGNPQ